MINDSVASRHHWVSSLLLEENRLNRPDPRFLLTFGATSFFGFTAGVGVSEGDAGTRMGGGHDGGEVHDSSDNHECFRASSAVRKDHLESQTRYEG